MKKQAFLKSFLILLPVLAVGLATTGDSVVVLDTQTGSVEHYAYFDMLPLETVAAIPALAGTLSGLAGILGIMHFANRKGWCLKGILWVSLFSACAASIPIVMQGVVRVMPNVGLPVFMLVNCLIAHILLKDSEKAVGKKAPRLG